MAWFPLAAAGYYYFNIPDKPRPNGNYSRRRTRSGIARHITEKFTLVDEPRDTPTLMIYGDGDSLVRFDHHALPPLKWMKEASLVTLKKGSHAGFAQQGSTILRFLRNPDSLACATLKWSIDQKPWDFVNDLGGAAVGIVQPEEDITPLTEPLILTAMKASRQHLFTSLATHAFLESQFADDYSTRRKAEHFLHLTLPTENRREVSVSR